MTYFYALILNTNHNPDFHSVPVDFFRVNQAIIRLQISMCCFLWLMLGVKIVVFAIGCCFILLNNAVVFWRYIDIGRAHSRWWQSLDHEFPRWRHITAVLNDHSVKLRRGANNSTCTPTQRTSFSYFLPFFPYLKMYVLHLSIYFSSGWCQKTLKRFIKELFQLWHFTS